MIYICLLILNLFQFSLKISQALILSHFVQDKLYHVPVRSSFENEGKSPHEHAAGVKEEVAQHLTDIKPPHVTKNHQFKIFQNVSKTSNYEIILRLSYKI